VTVPSAVFTGADAALTAYLSDGGDGLIWHFAEPPQVQRVKPGISSVRVRLEATRDA
jgi:alkylated DNA repair dioxygenase AlkB